MSEIRMDKDKWGVEGRRRGEVDGYRRGGHPLNPPTSSATAERSTPRGRVRRGVRRMTEWRRDRGKSARWEKRRCSC